MKWAPDQNEVRGPGGALRLRKGDRAARNLLLLVEGETSGRPLAEVLAEFGCSRSAYYEHLKRFQEEGVAGLLQRPPGPQKPWRRTNEAVRRIVLARLEDPSRSAESIARELAREDFRISVRSVERTLAEFGLTRRAPAAERPAPAAGPAESARAPDPEREEDPG